MSTACGSKLGVLLVLLTLHHAAASSLRIASPDATLQMGSAWMKMGCQGDEPAVSFIDSPSAIQPGRSVEVELSNVRPTCAGEHAGTPCAAHSPNYPKRFRCVWTFAGSNWTSAGVAANASLVRLESEVVAIRTFVVCKAPPAGPLIAQFGSAEAVALQLHVFHAGTPLPWVGDEGGNEFSLKLVSRFGSGADGELVTSGDTNLGDDEVNGEMVVKEYTSFTINTGHVVTTTAPKRGLLIYVTGDCVIDGTLSMTGRSAHFDPVSGGVSAAGLAFGMPTAEGSESLSPEGFAGAGAIAEAAVRRHAVEGAKGKQYVIGREGAAGAQGRSNDGAGNAGQDGTADRSNLRTGGGGGGGCGYHNGAHDSVAASAGAVGSCFSGGSGAGGQRDSQAGAQYVGAPPVPYGGRGGTGGGGGNWACGGGAGNPGGSRSAGGSFTSSAVTGGESGTGGLMILVCGGAIRGSGTLESKGSDGGRSSVDVGGSEPDAMGGGGSGGGVILVLHHGENSFGGTIDTSGGNGGVGEDFNGGSGGDGSQLVDQL